MLYRKASGKFSLDSSVLYIQFRYVKNIKKQGDQTALAKEEESISLERILIPMQ